MDTTDDPEAAAKKRASKGKQRAEGDVLLVNGEDNGEGENGADGAEENGANDSEEADNEDQEMGAGMPDELTEGLGCTLLKLFFFRYRKQPNNSALFFVCLWGRLHLNRGAEGVRKDEGGCHCSCCGFTETWQPGVLFRHRHREVVRAREGQQAL